MKTLILTITLLFFSLISLKAQNEQQQINEIKRDTSFVYATGTSSVSGEDASNNAKDLLALEIEQWLKSCSVDGIAGYVAKSRENSAQIRTQRGKLFRVFAYVNKADILPFYKKENVMVVDLVTQDESALPLTDSLVAVAEAKVDTLTADSALSVQKTKQSIEKPVDALPPTESVYTPSPKEQEMLAIHTFAALNDFVNHGRTTGSITQVGKYSNLPVTEKVYVFIHNREGNVPACLKIEDSACSNLATGKPDFISNYKGCGAIWIKIKD